MNKNKSTLMVVVSGTEIEVEYNVNTPLRTIVNHALAETGNSGQPASEWHLRNLQGDLLDLGKKIGEYGFTPGTKLFLNPGAGVTGGHRAAR